jgi:diguanylate cyclase (GGDEF)-like protein
MLNPCDDDPADLDERIGVLTRRVIELERQNRELRVLALHDPLTGLPNRRLLADRLRLAMARAQRSGHRLSVCCLDLDGFKAVNDQHGHAAGDSLLVAVARRLEQVLRAGETVARVGGDEFVLLLELEATHEQGASSVATVDAVLSRVQASVAAPLGAGETLLQVTASVGHVLYPCLCGMTGTAATAADVDGGTLLQLADRAMYDSRRARLDMLRRASVAGTARILMRPGGACAQGGEPVGAGMIGPCDGGLDAASAASAACSAP